MERITIYKITNLINQKLYVGLTNGTIENRWYMHTQPSSHCRRLKHSISKHGKENFKIEAIYTCFDYEHANEMEDYFIRYYNTISPNGYNLREGGQYGKVSDETRKIQSDFQIKSWSDPIKREKASVCMVERWKKCDRDHMLQGIIKYIEEKKLKVVGIDINSGEVVRFDSILAAENVYSNVWTCVTGSLFTAGGLCWFYDEGQTNEELKARALEVISNKKSNWKNLPGKEERLLKMREGSSHRFKPVVSVCIRSGSVKFYENVNDVLRDGFSASSVYSCLNGEAKTGQKFCWFYKTEDSDSYYKNLTENIVGGFKIEYVTPILATNKLTGEIIEYNNIDSVPYPNKIILRSIREAAYARFGFYWSFKK